jgi:hypothetical protein
MNLSYHTAPSVHIHAHIYQPHQAAHARRPCPTTRARQSASAPQPFLASNPLSFLALPFGTGRRGRL